MYKKMMRYSSVLLIILIAYSAYCFGVMIPYKNDTILTYSAKENLTITCTGTDEVTWMHSYNVEGGYTIIAETPYRKMLQIKNASAINAGIYFCVSKNNSDDFMRIFLFADASCYDGPIGIRISAY